jgi:hypothetical protein
VGLLGLALLLTSCATQEGEVTHASPCVAHGSSSGAPSPSFSTASEILKGAVAAYLQKPLNSVSVERTLLVQDVGFVVFTFSDAGRTDHGFGAFKLHNKVWIANQVATGLWPTLPSACSDEMRMLSLQVGAIACSGGYVDPTIDRIDAISGSRLLYRDHPVGGAALVLAPAGAELVAFRAGIAVARRSVVNPSPS